MENQAKPTKTVRPFQRRVSDLVISGKNVVLQAPTGAGKTRAALEPFVRNLRGGAGASSALPVTCRYAVPLRTLANQFFAEHADLAARIDRASPSVIARSYADQKLKFVAQQTGERQDDPQFEAGLTFCTIDQLLAAFVGIPYGVGMRQTNLKVAGVFGSYIVLDEWHLYPLRSLGKEQRQGSSGARATSLAMLAMLHEQRLARFVLMTATFSTTLLHGLADLLGAELESLREEPRDGETAEQAFRREFQEIAGGRARTVQRHPRPLEESLEEVLGGHMEHRDSTLVLCNTVDRAQRTYLRLRELSARYGPEAPQLLLLHARFSAADRRAATELLEATLGSDAWEMRARGGAAAPNLIVVATQVVEVGLNISVRELHSEIAPANSLIQRAGRCARFAAQRGTVHIYPLAEGARHLPYSDALCLDTLADLADEPEPFDFAREQALIDRVHKAEDSAFLQSFGKVRGEIKEQIFKGWRSFKPASASELIRDVRQVALLIHDAPNDAITEEPWRWQAFGMHPDSLRGRWDRLQELIADRDCGPLRRLEPVGNDDPQADSRTPMRYHWAPMVNAAEIGAALMIVLPTALAHYDPALGFALRDPLRFPELEALYVPAAPWHSSKLPPTTRNGGNYGRDCQSYEEHISGLVHAYQAGLADEMGYAASRLEPLLDLPPGSIDAAVRLAIACHDIGKLAVVWQDRARAWQDLVAAQPRRIAAPPSATLLAKTVFDPAPDSGHVALQKDAPRLPWHAVEGALFAERLLQAALIQVVPGDGRKRLVRAVRTAIARHHTIDAHENKEAHLAPGADGAVREALRLACGGYAWHAALPAPTPVQLSKNHAPEFFFTDAKEGDKDQAETWLYFLIVRALRLADQRADAMRTVAPSNRT